MSYLEPSYFYVMEMSRVIFTGRVKQKKDFCQRRWGLGIGHVTWGMGSYFCCVCQSWQYKVQVFNFFRFSSFPIKVRFRRSAWHSLSQFGFLKMTSVDIILIWWQYIDWKVLLLNYSAFLSSVEDNPHLLCYCITTLHPIRNHTKIHAILPYTFSRAFSPLPALEFDYCFDWLTGLPVSFVVGQGGLLELSWKPL